MTEPSAERAIPAAPPGAGTGRVWALGSAIVIALLGFAPITWLLGRGTPADYMASVGEWTNGVLLAALAGVAFAVLTRRSPLASFEGAAQRLVNVWEAREVALLCVLSLVAFLVYCVVAWSVHGARPLIVDELSQLEHARIFASGRLWIPTPAYPEFTSTYLFVDAGEKVFSQFPPGGPAALALGVLLGAPWIVGPLFGAVAVVSFGCLTRVTERRAGVRLAAVLLFAFCPFVAFMSGSMMNHVPTLALLLAGAACAIHALQADRARPVLSLAGGFAIGAAAAVRPVDALACALPLAVWMVVRASRDRSRWRDALGAGLGVGIPVCLTLWVNAQTTGAPLLFGYEALWGKAHGLGFHPDPSGAMHTPANGLALLGHYAVLMQTHLFEGPLPALLPVVLSLVCASQVTASDRWLLASAALLSALYAAYWYDGNYLGPRFLFPLAPLLVLWTARLPTLVRERFGSRELFRGTIFGFAAAGALAIAVGIPTRAKSYRNYSSGTGWSVDSAAVTNNVRGALVFVRESWGSQLIARMWALGLSRTEASWLFRRVDTCQLDGAIQALEAKPRYSNAGVFAGLAPLASDSLQVIASPFSPRTQERFRPGVVYGDRCRARIADDLRGVTQLHRAMASNRAGNMYVRTLQGRDTLLMAAHPTREVYLLAPADSLEPLPLRFTKLSVDSLLLAARMESPAPALGVSAGPASRW